MKQTAIYGLRKPEGTDVVNIDDLNYNADVLDKELKGLNDVKVDKVSGKQLSTEDYTTAEKQKLSGIEAGATKYNHPSTHPGNIITEDATHRWSTDTEKANWNDANNRKHDHGNKSILDGITQALVNGWNSATTHISDAIKHITADERNLWNTVSNKVDKIAGKQLSTEDYTTIEKQKLVGIATGANNYVHPNDPGTRHVTDEEKSNWNKKSAIIDNMNIYSDYKLGKGVIEFFTDGSIRETVKDNKNNIIFIKSTSFNSDGSIEEKTEGYENGKIASQYIVKTNFKADGSIEKEGN